MSVSTSNAYGKISISDLAIAKVAAQAAMESYGIVDTVARRFTETLAELLKKDAGFYFNRSLFKYPSRAKALYNCSKQLKSSNSNKMHIFEKIIFF